MEHIPEFYGMYWADPLEQGTSEMSEVERITNEFESHEGDEEEVIGRYKEIAQKSKNPAVKFLFNLIISDEEKHRAVTHAILSTLKGALTWTKSPDALTGLYDLGEEKEGLLKLTEEFIQLEKKGIKEYKKLLGESKQYYQGLLGLLLNSMIRDSEKHAEILEFLRQRMKES